MTSDFYPVQVNLQTQQLLLSVYDYIFKHIFFCASDLLRYLLS